MTEKYTRDIDIIMADGQEIAKLDTWTRDGGLLTLIADANRAARLEAILHRLVDTRIAGLMSAERDMTAECMYCGGKSVWQNALDLEQHHKSDCPIIVARNFLEKGA